MSTISPVLITPGDEPQCQVMKPNKTQCTNPGWAFIDSVPYCRLHFSYEFANRNGTGPDPVGITKESQAEVQVLLDQEQVKRDDLLAEEKLKADSAVEDIAGV